MNIDSIHEMTASTVPLGVPKGPTIGDDEKQGADGNLRAVVGHAVHDEVEVREHEDDHPEVEESPKAVLPRPYVTG